MYLCMYFMYPSIYVCVCIYEFVRNLQLWDNFSDFFNRPVKHGNAFSFDYKSTSTFCVILPSSLFFFFYFFNLLLLYVFSLFCFWFLPLLIMYYFYYLMIDNNWKIIRGLFSIADLFS